MKIMKLEEAQKLAQDSKIIQTCCNGCVFSKPQSDENEDLDAYCSAGRLTKFKELGEEIISIRLDSDKDDEPPKNYKAVNGRACNLLRPNYWKGLMEHRGVKEEDLLQTAKKEIETSCAFIVYIDGTEHVKDPIEIDKIVSKTIETFESIERGDIQASRVIIINPCISPTDFVNFFRAKIYAMYSNSDIPESRRTPWDMEYIPYQDAKDIEKLAAGKKELDETLSDEEFRQAFIKRHIDLAAKAMKAQYYSFFFSGDLVPSNYLSDINTYINEGGKRLIALKSDDVEISSGIFVQKLIHKQLAGNKGGFILDKIEQLTKDQECPELLKKTSEIVKNLK
jgi:hypothetical protein